MSPTPRRPLPRRTVLTACGTAVLAAATACSSAGSPSTTTSSSAAPSPVTGSRPAATDSGSPATSPTTGAGATGDPAPTGTPLASVADVRSAGSVVVQSAGGPLLLAYADGTVVAHTAVCSHQQCTIAASGTCPCHGSAFDVATGAVLNGPALRPLAQEQVTVSGGQVFLS